MSDDDILAKYEGLFERELPKKYLVPADPVSMPEEFARSTMLALRVQQAILAMELNERDPHYRAKLAAQTAIASAQITAQLKADETKLRSQGMANDYSEEIKLAIERAKELYK